MYIPNIEVYYINIKNTSSGTISKTVILLQPEIFPVIRNYSYMSERMQKYLEVIIIKIY